MRISGTEPSSVILSQMYPVELEMKETTESNTSASGFTSVDRDGRLSSYFHLWQSWWFQFQYNKFTVPE